MQGRLMSEDYGKHLMGVEDLLQRHNVLEADIKLVRDRIDNCNMQAGKFVHADEDEFGGKRLSFLQVIVKFIIVIWYISVIVNNHVVFLCKGSCFG